jgi:hypothetical protein
MSKSLSEKLATRLSAEEAAAHSGIDAKRIAYLIEYGQMLGETGPHGTWVTEFDLETYVNGMAIDDELIRAHKAHRNLVWGLGNCAACDRMMPVPTGTDDRWICSEVCAKQAADATLVPSY